MKSGKKKKNTARGFQKFSKNECKRIFVVKIISKYNDKQRFKSKLSID